MFPLPPLGGGLASSRESPSRVLEIGSLVPRASQVSQPHPLFKRRVRTTTRYVNSQRRITTKSFAGIRAVAVLHDCVPYIWGIITRGFPATRLDA